MSNLNEVELRCPHCNQPVDGNLQQKKEDGIVVCGRCQRKFTYHKKYVYQSQPLHPFVERYQKPVCDKHHTPMTFVMVKEWYARGQCDIMVACLECMEEVYNHLRKFGREDKWPVRLYLNDATASIALSGKDDDELNEDNIRVIKV